MALKSIEESMKELEDINKKISWGKKVPTKVQLVVTIEKGSRRLTIKRELGKWGPKTLYEMTDSMIPGHTKITKKQALQEFSDML